MLQISDNPLTAWLQKYLASERAAIETGTFAPDFNDFPEDMRDFMREEYIENVIGYLDHTIKLLLPKEGESQVSIPNDQLPGLVKGLTHWRLYLRTHALQELSDLELEALPETMQNLPDKTDPIALIAYDYLAAIQGYALHALSPTAGDIGLASP